MTYPRFLFLYKYFIFNHFETLSEEQSSQQLHRNLSIIFVKILNYS